MLMKLDWKSCLKAGVTLFALYLCIYYWPGVSGFIKNLTSAFISLLAGGAIAYVINILMSFYERHYFPQSSKKAVLRSRRPVCLALSIITILALIALIIALVLPQLASCVRVLASEIPEAIESIIGWLERIGIISQETFDMLSTIDWKSRLDGIGKALLTGLGGVMGALGGVLSATVSGFASAFLGIIFALYLLSGKEALYEKSHNIMRRIFKPSHYEKLCYILSTFNDSFHKYIVGQCTEAVILGVLCMAGMLLLRLPYAAMIGALIAFTALIPVAGAYIGAGIGAFMILTVSPVQALIFLIFIVVLQQIEGNLIYPKVVGSSLGLPGIWVLAAVTVGGGLFGIFGMLLGVPIAAALYKMLEDHLSSKSI